MVGTKPASQDYNSGTVSEESRVTREGNAKNGSFPWETFHGEATMQSWFVTTLHMRLTIAPDRLQVVDLGGMIGHMGPGRSMKNVIGAVTNGSSTMLPISSGVGRPARR